MKMIEHILQSIVHQTWNKRLQCINCIPKLEIKDFDVLIDGKGFLDVPIKNKEEIRKQITEMSKNNDCTTGKLLDYEYFSKHYKLVPIEIKQKNWIRKPDIKQQINFISGLEEDNGVTVKNQKKTLLIFHNIL